MDQYFAFRAHNEITRYGWGSRQEADRYCDHLNAGREIDLYQVQLLTSADMEQENLADRDDIVNLNDELAAIAGIR